MKKILPTKTISEFGIIRKSKDLTQENDSFSEIYLEEKSFDALKNLAFEEKNSFFFQYSIRKGSEQIQVRNFVGLLETKYLKLEILPKIGSQNQKLAKSALLQMLRLLQNSPFKIFDEAQLKKSDLPLYEIFIETYLNELEKILSQGVLQNYLTIETNEDFLRGKLNITENIKKNLNNQNRFQIIYDEFSPNISLNRILKSTLHSLENQSVSPKNKQKIYDFFVIFNDIDYSSNYNKDFLEIEKNKQKFGSYQTLMEWSKIFLSNHSFAPFSGNQNHHSLLFPTEILFENYVGKLFRKYFSETYEIKIQIQDKYLIDRHLEEGKFRTKPDIQLISTDKKTFIFDTKWKFIDSQKPNQNYLIEQSDLYQMYAYGKKYNAEKVFLIYPAHENFYKPLQVFSYEQNMNLFVLPFDLTNPPKKEISKIESFL